MIELPVMCRSRQLSILKEMKQMKTLTVFLIVALVLVGVGALAVQALTISSNSTEPAVPVLSISEPEPPVYMACDPVPCGCPNGC
ncbi:MAG: hypothetical protein HY868_11915 [Chloroflexi bacterium]|nr:hypothetical protein [Chloroflexota bacterium]